MHVLDHGPFPAVDHRGVDVILLGEFGRRHFLADGFQSHLRLELRRIAFPFGHFSAFFLRRYSLTPGPNSREHLSKSGQADIRRLLIIGAMARQIWAMMTKGEDFRDSAPASAA